MPFRQTRWAMLALFPLILFAFWPGYFSMMRDAPLALHAHGLAAMAWMLLVACQLWMIHARRVRLHRAAGLLVFAVVPLFAAGSLLAMRDGARLAAVAADPFHARFGAQLVLVDLVALVALVTLVAAGLRARRRVAVHAGAMVATVLLALPPVLARLYTGPLIALGGLSFVPAFAVAFHAGTLSGAALALWLGRGPAALPLRATAVVLLSTELLFETVGRSAGWTALLGAMSAIPALPLALIGLVAAAAALWLGWSGGPAGTAARPLRNIISEAGG